MNRTAVFSKTGKGLLEVKNRANKLTRDQYKVLGLVDGKSSLDDLIDKVRVPELELRKILTSLSDGGYIKEFANAANDIGAATALPTASYVDDLDFTQILGPAKSGRPSVYTSGESERRQREEAERKAAEVSATKAREEAERRAKEEAAAKAAQTAALKIREEAERRAQLEEERREQMAAQMRAKAEAEAKAKAEAERRAKEEAERKVRIEAEVRARIETERKAKEEALRKAREEEERRRKEEEERKRREEEERRRKEEEERRRKEEEERKRREEEERRRKEEEERKRREEEERKRREEEERRRKEEEERKRREEEERKRREEEERRRKEEEERRRREEEERRRREEEERKRREEEERLRKEEEERRRREEEERRRKEEAERRLRELEEQHRREEEALRQRMEEQRRRIEAGEFVDAEEEARKAQEEEERRRREIEEERRRREEEERRWREEDERRRREEEERGRREEEERRQREQEQREQEQREQEERRRRAEEEERKRLAALAEPATVDFPSLDRVETPKAAHGAAVAVGFEAQLESLQSAEEQIEQELRLKEDAIRRQLEEQERRFRMEEEARVAMDRAEREAQEKADREAKELALSAERARKDAEQRSREEGARRAQEEKDKRAREQEERRKQAEEERKKRERERREAEQRSREEELARRRKEQEEADRRKAELDRIQREARKSRLGPGKIAAIVVVVVALLGLTAIEVAPMSAYAPAIEKLASDRLGEPVRIGNVHMSVLNGFHLKLENVTVGVNQDVRIPTAFVYMSFGSLFADHKDVTQLQLESMSASQDAIARLRGWLAGPAEGRTVSVERVTLKAAKLEVPQLTLPTFDAELRLGPDGVRMATVHTTDGHLDLEVMPGEQGVQVQARGRNFVLPISPGIEFADFTAEATASGNQLRVTQMTYSLYGAQGKATGTVGWGSAWTVDGDFEFQRMELETAMKAVQAAIPSEGMLDARGRLSGQAASVDGLFGDARVDAVFIVRKGNLSGLDLVRALQSPSRDGVTGGKTRFDEMSGNFSANAGRYQVNGVKLQAGAMNANGQVDIAQNQDVSGRIYVELRSTATAIRGNFRVLGTLKGMVLKP